jgi:hypothetical protein
MNKFALSLSFSVVIFCLMCAFFLLSACDAQPKAAPAPSARATDCNIVVNLAPGESFGTHYASGSPDDAFSMKFTRTDAKPVILNGVTITLLHQIANAQAMTITLKSDNTFNVCQIR